MRQLLALAAVGAIVVGCVPGRTVLPTPDASASLAVSTRIAEIGRGQDWYGAIHQLSGRPDAAKIGPEDGFFPVEVQLNRGVDPVSPLAVRACDAIAAAVNNPKYGPSLQVSIVTVINNVGSHDCRPPADTEQGPPS